MIHANEVKPMYPGIYPPDIDNQATMDALHRKQALLRPRHEIAFNSNK